MQVKAKGIVGLCHGAFDHPKFVSEVGREYTDGIMTVNYHVNPHSLRAKKTLADFEAKFGSTMSPSQIYAYIPVPVIADAIERAKSTDREAIQKALTQTKFNDHILPQGPIEFNAEGQNVNALSLLMQINNSEIKVVWPKKYSEADLVFPFKG